MKRLGQYSSEAFQAPFKCVSRESQTGLFPDSPQRYSTNTKHRLTGVLGGSQGISEVQNLAQAFHALTNRTGYEMGISPQLTSCL